MKNAEMQVLRFDAGDVIATSMVCAHTDGFHLQVTNLYQDSQNAWVVDYEGYSWESGSKKFEFVGGDTGLAVDGNFADPDQVTQGGWYYSYNKKWVACEDGVSHPTN